MKQNIGDPLPEVHLAWFSDKQKKEIDARLRDRIAGLIEFIEGVPGRPHGRHEMRWGAKSGLAVMVSGPDQGRITPFDGDGKGRTPITHIKEFLGLSYAEAWVWAANFVGISTDHQIAPEIERKREARHEEVRKQSEAIRASEDAKRIEAAREIAAASIPIQGTNAEAYLGRRGIKGPFPDDVRYSPRDNALLVIARDVGGEIQAVQRVFLLCTQKMHMEGGAKRSRGKLDGAAVRLPGPGGPELILAEGPETGLSLWCATRIETWIALGSVANLAVHNFDGRKVIAARDNDPTGSQADKAFNKAVERIVDGGHAVCVASPPMPSGAKGYDFNDALCDHGEEAVRQAVQIALRNPASNYLPALYPRITGTIDDARAKNAKFTAEWADRTVEYWRRRQEYETALEESVFVIPPQPTIDLAIGVTGIGKSHAARSEITRIVGDRPTGTAIYYLVPTHRLGQEQADAFKQLGVAAKVYRGREQPDPEIDGRKMCWLSDLAVDVQRGGGDPARLCGVTDGENITLCPHFRDCGFQRQLREPADVIVAAHNHLAHPVPKGLPPVAAGVIDEDPVGKLMKGFDSAVRVSLHDLRTPPNVPRRDGMSGIDYDATADLSSSMLAVYTALDSAAVGDRFETAGLADLVATDLVHARDLIFRCKKEIKPRPDWTPSEVSQARQDAKENVRLVNLARLLDMCARGLENGLSFVPGLRVDEVETDEGQRYKAARLRWRSEIHEHWRKPTLIMDATVQPDMLRPFWHLDRIGNFDAEAPHMRVRLVPWSASAGKLRTGKKAVDRIRRYIEVEAMTCRRVLVICQKKVEARLLTDFGIPMNVDIAHFGAIRGVDEWKNVDRLILIGRTMPSPDAAEMMAEVLFDHVPERSPLWQGSYYPHQFVGSRMRGQDDGPAVRLEFHPDPYVEVVRRSVCEAEAIQAIGRVRGVNRSADKPVQIDIISTIPLPVEIDEVIRYEEVEPHPLDVVAARGEVIQAASSTKGFWNAVAFLLPDLFETPDAARMALTRTNANKAYIISKCSRESDFVGFPVEKLKPPGSRYAVPIKSHHVARRFGERKYRMPEVWRHLKVDKT